MLTTSVERTKYVQELFNDPSKIPVLPRDILLIMEEKLSPKNLLEATRDEEGVDLFGGVVVGATVALEVLRSIYAIQNYKTTDDEEGDD